jgi:pimeloyl-ACP methyl ester carboxylesterase
MGADPGRERRAAAATLSVLLSLAGCAHQAAAPPGTLQKDVVFTEYSPLSRDAELARRALTPLTFHSAERLWSSGPGLREQAVDLARERFALYVPGGPPPEGGWGLLVFVAPWSEATEPQRWRPALDRHGLIFVSAANSGNDVKILDRRLPLALLAWHNVRARYPIDPSRVYVGGLSGGSRAAEVAALAYPDVFRGALLNAGSDPIGGEQGIYLPPAELVAEFRRSRLVLVTGQHDELNLHDDLVTRDSLKAWCVFDLVVEVAPRLGHEPLDPASLDRALDALEQRAPVDAERLARCDERVRRELSARLAEAEAALARGDRAGARARLKAIDARFGGLAAPAILELDAKVAGRE